MGDPVVRIASGSDTARWASLRAPLWPEDSEAEHGAAARAWRARPDTRAFVALAEDGEMVGFAEASLRRDHVNGCDTTPVAFLEGIYVPLPACRRRGTTVRCGRGVGQVDGQPGTRIGYRGGPCCGPGLPRRSGFEERERIVFFRKRL